MVVDEKWIKWEMIKNEKMRRDEGGCVDAGDERLYGYEMEVEGRR